MLLFSWWCLIFKAFRNKRKIACLQRNGIHGALFYRILSFKKYNYILLDSYLYSPNASFAATDVVVVCFLSCLITQQYLNIITRTEKWGEQARKKETRETSNKHKNLKHYLINRLDNSISFFLVVSLRYDLITYSLC